MKKPSFAKSLIGLLLFIAPLCALAQPTNNPISSAILLNSAGSCSSTSGALRTGTNSATGTAGLNTFCSATATTPDVWYYFTALSTNPTIKLSGMASLTGANNSMDDNPGLQIFNTGSTSTSIVTTISATTLNSAAEQCTNGTSQTTLSLTPASALTVGNVYLVRVFTTSTTVAGTASNWNFSICVTDANPSNDLCAGAKAITSAGTCSNTAGTLVGATNTTITGECVVGKPDVWYSFTAQSTTPTITTTGNAGIRLQVYTAASCGGTVTSKTCISGVSGSATSLTVGNGYLVRVYLNSGTASTFNICITDPAPSNDDCSVPPTLTSASSCSGTAGTMIGSTLTSSAPAPSCGTPTCDVWYQFTAKSTSPTISITGNTGFTDPHIQLISGRCDSMVTESCSSTGTLNVSNIHYGQTYYVRVYSTNPVPTSSGAFSICITDPAIFDVSSSRMVEVFKRTVLSNNVLNTPWEVTYGPDGYLWITESQGYKAYRMDPTTGATSTILDISKGSVTTELTGTEHTNYNAQFNTTSLNAITGTWYTKVPWPQGGFAGMAIHPEFNSGKPYVFISYVHKFDSASITNNGGYYFKNSIVRFTYNSVSGKLESPVTIVDTLPGSSDHNSQRMIIAPLVKGGTYYLFYGQGEMGAGQLVNQWRPNYAQDTTHYHGKILRFNIDQDADTDPFDKWIPNDNPYNKTGHQSAVWAIGFRNNQGFAFDTTYGVLYGASHGPYSDDEINIIQRYHNYGHPIIEGYAADGNYNGSTVAGTVTAYTAGAPFTVSSGNSTLPPIGNEQHNADSINASGFAKYKDPLFSAYPGPDASTHNTLSVDSIWKNNPGNGNWPSEAWSGIDIYKNTVIPGWKNSILACGLKWGRVLRLKLGQGDSTIIPTDGVDTVVYFQSHNRYRDLAFDPNGKDIYVSMESSTTSGPAAGTQTVPQCTNCVIKYTFLGYTDAGGKSTIPDAISITDTASTSYALANTVDSATQITIDASNSNYWVPITGPDGNILAEINSNGQTLGVVKSAFFKHTGGIRVKKGVHYLNRNITITPQFQPSDSVKVRLYVTKDEFDSLALDAQGGIVGGISGLYIFKNSDPASPAIASSTIPVNTTVHEAHGNGYVLQGNIGSFSSFYFAASNITLPLNLVSFKGVLKNNNTALDWETTNEVNTSKFIIERSTDGRNFQQIGTEDARGTTGRNTYAFTDYDASHQASLTLYYRLKMMDQDGQFTYSNIVTITLPALSSRVSVFPNPAHNQVQVSINAVADGKIQWSLTDNAGHIVMSSASDIKKGSNSLTISTAALSTGFYYLSINGAGIDQKVKLAKM